MKIFQKLIFLCSVILALAVSGCVFIPEKGKKTDAESVRSALIKGKTTKEEVVVLYGQPYSKSASPNGEHWTYVYMESYNSFKDVLSMGRQGSSNRETQSLMIHFVGGVVKDFTFSTVGGKDQKVEVPAAKVNMTAEASPSLPENVKAAKKQKK